MWAPAHLQTNERTQVTLQKTLNDDFLDPGVQRCCDMSSLVSLTSTILTVLVYEGCIVQHSVRTVPLSVNVACPLHFGLEVFKPSTTDMP